MTDPTTIDAPQSERRVHVIGAGPVGLLMTAMLQSMEGFSIRLYEKRPAYTRTRMVRLASYLTAESISAYCADEIDGDTVSAIFEPSELEKGLNFRRSINPRLFALLQRWDQGFCRLKDIEESLNALINEGGKSPVERIQSVLTVEQAMAVLQPHEIMIDCTGANSLLRDHLVPPSANEADSRERNTYKRRLEYAANVTKLFDVTASVPVLIKSGQTSGNYVAAQYSNAGGEWILVCNETGDHPLRFNGTTWETADPFATIRGIYERLGAELTPEAEQRMRSFLAANPGDGGGHRYRFADTGLVWD
jgi:hypothetical protein